MAGPLYRAARFSGFRQGTSDMISEKTKRTQIVDEEARAKQRKTVDARAAEPYPQPTPTPEEVHEAMGYDPETGAPPGGPPPVEAAPVVTSLSPNSAVAGDEADITMVVNGSGFNESSVIVFNSYDEPTTLISDTKVSTGVKPSLFIVPADCPVAVRNGSVTSNAVIFSFTAAAQRSAARSRRESERKEP